MITSSQFHMVKLVSNKKESFVIIPWRRKDKSVWIIIPLSSINTSAYCLTNDTKPDQYSVRFRLISNRCLFSDYSLANHTDPKFLNRITPILFTDGDNTDQTETGKKTRQKEYTFLRSSRNCSLTLFKQKFITEIVVSNIFFFLLTHK